MLTFISGLIILIKKFIVSAQVDINSNSLSLLFNDKMILICFMLLSQFIFGSSLVYTSSLKDSVGGCPANNPEFYIADNTVVTNRQQVYVKNSIPKKEKAKGCLEKRQPVFFVYIFSGILSNT